MPLFFHMIIGVALTPAILIILHALIHRIMSRCYDVVVPQRSCLFAVALLNLSWGIALWRVWPAPWAGGLPDGVVGAGWVFLTLNALGFFYFFMVNIAVTSIHMHILLRIFWRGKLSEEELLENYDAEHMMSQRMERLVGLGQISIEGDDVKLASSTYVKLSWPIYFWRQILGLEIQA